MQLKNEIEGYPKAMEGKQARNLRDREVQSVVRDEGGEAV